MLNIFTLKSFCWMYRVIRDLTMPGKITALTSKTKYLGRKKIQLKNHLLFELVTDSVVSLPKTNN